MQKAWLCGAWGRGEKRLKESVVIHYEYGDEPQFVEVMGPYSTLYGKLNSRVNTAVMFIFIIHQPEILWNAITNVWNTYVPVKCTWHIGQQSRVKVSTVWSSDFSWKPLTLEPAGRLSSAWNTAGTCWNGILHCTGGSLWDAFSPSLWVAVSCTSSWESNVRGWLCTGPRAESSDPFCWCAQFSLLICLPSSLVACFAVSFGLDSSAVFTGKGFCSGPREIALNLLSSFFISVKLRIRFLAFGETFASFTWCSLQYGGNGTHWNDFIPTFKVSGSGWGFEIWEHCNGKLNVKIQNNFKRRIQDVMHTVSGELGFQKPSTGMIR